MFHRVFQLTSPETCDISGRKLSSGDLVEVVGFQSHVYIVDKDIPFLQWASAARVLWMATIGRSDSIGVRPLANAIECALTFPHYAAKLKATGCAKCRTAFNSARRRAEAEQYESQPDYVGDLRKWFNG